MGPGGEAGPGENGWSLEERWRGPGGDGWDLLERRDLGEMGGAWRRGRGLMRGVEPGGEVEPGEGVEPGVEVGSGGDGWDLWERQGLGEVGET